MTPVRQMKSGNEDRFHILSKDSLNLKDIRIGSDCAHTDGRFQHIILVSTKDQDSPASDSK